MKTRKPARPSSHRDGRKSALVGQDPDNAQVPNYSDATNTIYGLVPVLEALRAGNKRLEQIMITEGARHERLRELLDLAKRSRVPVHRAPRIALDRVLPGVSHQGIIGRTAAARYRDPEELLEELGAQVAAANKPLVLGLDAVEDPRNLGAILRTAECA
jgi:23S rRNA (guanosine2251-2'-O)-methyltransferase